jgi:hypothetical protein
VKKWGVGYFIDCGVEYSTIGGEIIQLVLGYTK